MSCVFEHFMEFAHYKCLLLLLLLLLLLISSFLEIDFEIDISDKKSRRLDLSEVIFKCIKVL